MLKGILAKAIWQHPIACKEGYNFSEYFDPADEGNQIVIHTKTQIPKPDSYFSDQEIIKLEIDGTIFEFQAHSKRSTDEESYPVQQILVDKWKII